MLVGFSSNRRDAFVNRPCPSLQKALSENNDLVVRPTMKSAFFFFHPSYLCPPAVRTITFFST